MSTENRIPVLKAQGLVKHYGHIIALDEADLEVYPSEVLAVIGDNGAGKSTLIKVLSGAVIPDKGQVFLNDQPIHFTSPIDARRVGIETVYQNLAVAPALTIVENLFLGRELRRAGMLGSVFGLLDKKKMYAQAQDYMSDLKFRIPSVSQPVETLSGGQAQGVAVARSAAFAASDLDASDGGLNGSTLRGGSLGETFRFGISAAREDKSNPDERRQGR